jgi:hypothetical protein
VLLRVHVIRWGAHVFKQQNPIASFPETETEDSVLTTKEKEKDRRVRIRPGA